MYKHYEKKRVGKNGRNYILVRIDVYFFKYNLAVEVDESVKCRKKTKNLDPKIFETKNKRLIMKSKFSLCGIKKSRFEKKQEAKALLSSLGS